MASGEYLPRRFAASVNNCYLVESSIITYIRVSNRPMSVIKGIVKSTSVHMVLGNNMLCGLVSAGSLFGFIIGYSLTYGRC